MRLDYGIFLFREYKKYYIFLSDFRQRLSIHFFGRLPHWKELLLVFDDEFMMPFVNEVATTATDHMNPKLDELVYPRDHE